MFSCCCSVLFGLCGSLLSCCLSASLFGSFLFLRRALLSIVARAPQGRARKQQNKQQQRKTTKQTTKIRGDKEREQRGHDGIVIMVIFDGKFGLDGLDVQPWPSPKINKLMSLCSHLHAVCVCSLSLLCCFTLLFPCPLCCCSLLVASSSGFSDKRKKATRNPSPTAPPHTSRITHATQHNTSRINTSQAN